MLATWRTAPKNKAMKAVIGFFLFCLVGCAAPTNPKVSKQLLLDTKLLVVNQLTPNTFQHISYKQTDDFGYVPCNGLVFRNGNEAVVFDSPTTDSAANVLLQWISNSLHCKVVAVVPMHFHDDCTGGLNAFHNAGIPSIARSQTIALAKKNGVPIPQQSFEDSISIEVGAERV